MFFKGKSSSLPIEQLFLSEKNQQHYFINWVSDKVPSHCIDLKFRTFSTKLINRAAPDNDMKISCIPQQLIGHNMLLFKEAVSRVKTYFEYLPKGGWEEFAVSLWVCISKLLINERRGKFNTRLFASNVEWNVNLLWSWHR